MEVNPGVYTARKHGVRMPMNASHLLSVDTGFPPTGDERHAAGRQQTMFVLARVTVRVGIGNCKLNFLIVNVNIPELATC